MAVYVTTPKTGIVRNACARTQRLVVVTDASSAASLPSELVGAADAVRTRSFGFAAFDGYGPGGDAVLVWMAGETLLRGNAADLRRALYSHPPVDSNALVHLQYLEGADLLSVQPRIRVRGAQHARLNPALRIAGNASASPPARSALESNGEPWALLYLALLAEAKRPGAGIEALKDLWQRPALSPHVSALILRNLIVVLMRQEEFARAEELLSLAANAFPGYAEIPYLHALLWMQQKKFSKAVPFLENALKMSSGSYPGSGGENSYRSQWLLGVICETGADQEKAVQCWLPAVNERPAFAPSVRALLNQRMPRTRAARLTQPVGELARREPAYIEMSVNFFLEHDLVEPASKLLNTSAIDSAARETLGNQVIQAESRRRARPSDSKERPGVVFEGPFLTASGHARTNRALALSLLASKEFDVGLDPWTWPTLGVASMFAGEALWNGILHHPRTSDLTIRHVWPPNFLRPPGGKLVCIVPWEHRAVGSAISGKTWTSCGCPPNSCGAHLWTEACRRSALTC